MPALVIDLGGTHLRCAVAVNGCLRELSRARVDNFVDGHAPREIWERLASRIAQYHARALPLLPPAAPIVMAFPGPIGPEGRVLDAPTLAGPGGVFPDLQAELARRTGRRVRLLNDVSAAAWHLSTRTGARRFLVVTVSSGIGSKLFDRAHPAGVIDDPPYAGEIGHVVVDPAPDAPVCDCGGRGHLGAVSSGRGVERLARRAAARDGAAFAASLCARRFGAAAGTLVNERHVAPAARLCDPWTLGVLREASGPLARTLVTLVAACGLEKVFLIGGFAASLGSVYLEIVRELAERACQYRILQPRIREMIEAGEAGGEVCLRGAAVFAERLADAP